MIITIMETKVKSFYPHNMDFLPIIRLSQLLKNPATVDYILVKMPAEDTPLIASFPVLLTFTADVE